MSSSFHSLNWKSAFGVLVLLALIALIPVATPVSISAAQVQPLLLEMAFAQPDATVSIIVQKSTKDSQVENLLATLGGRITDDLWMINGFAAQVKAKDVSQLASTYGVHAISWDAPVKQTDCADCTTTGLLANNYIKAIRSDQGWLKKFQGQGIGVAVVDSGVNWQTDLYSIMGVNRVVANVGFNNGYNVTTFDAYGHGSHVAGVVGGNGRMSNGAYIGVAPQANIINVKVSDDLNNGAGTAKTLVQGLQWVLQNKNTYNIRVVNISINSTVAESYHTSPIDAAAEILWLNGIVVVVSAGNSGSGTIYPPANDPFVITVGATDDKGTATLSDDAVAAFSVYGKTSDGFDKPDLVAPGKNIVSLMGNTNGSLPTDHPANVVKVNGSPTYFRMSGTSTSAPMVAGAVAQLLQDEPKLNPDQVKYRLKATANKSWAGYSATKAGAGYLDVYAAVMGTTTGTANTGLAISKMLFTGTSPANSGSASWGSASWGSASWGSANWDSASWGSASWGSDYWGP
ncbi:MAG: S8 family peptidase [Chloroflexi bacterium]|nr:S8 family peptidase [Chloroflexota bacterium]